MSCRKLVECCTTVVLTFCPYSSSNCLTFCVGRVFFTLFVMFSCAPDPCRIFQVILSPLVRFCSESFLCPTIASINKIIIIKSEDLKRLEYEERIVTVERGSFCPLVFSTSGAVGPLCDRFLKRLAGKMSDLDKANYSEVMAYLRCRISFALLRSAVMCIRGSRSSRHSPAFELQRQVALAEGHFEDS